MEIAQIVSTLREKIGNTSLSERLLREYVTAVNPQVEPDEAFWQTHTAILKSLNGQYSHDIAEWVKANKPKPAPAEPEPQQKPEPNGIDPAVQALIDAQRKSIEKLEAMVAGQQAKQSQDAIRNGAFAQADTLKVSNRNIWNDAVSRVAITEGMTPEQFTEQVKVTYAANLKAFVGEGVQPYGNAQPSDPSAQTKQAFDAFFANKKGFEPKQ